MPKKVGRCQYEFWGKSICKRKALPDSKDQYCICHEPSDEKGIKKFNSEIRKIMQNEKAEFYDFQGFYFPISFDFENIDQYLEKGTFKKNVNFWGATFQGGADFESASFQEADFRDATFQGGAHFKSANFLVPVLFWNTTFQKASFIGTTFQGCTTFLFVIFQEADFKGATFQEKVFFLNTIFQGKADFRTATFQEAARFSNTTFQGKVNFSSCEEEGVKYLTEFKSADFDHTTFEKRTDFEKCTIKKEIDFQYARFYDELSLTNINYYWGKKSKEVPILDFRNTRFSNTTRIDRGTNLTNALFDLDSAQLVEFTDAHFPDKILEERIRERYECSKTNDILQKILCFFKKRKGNLEEEIPPEGDYVVSWDRIESIYCRLKQAHLKYGLNQKVEDFSYREWECDRLSKSRGKDASLKSKILSCLFWIYKWSCGYGKKPYGLLCWGIIAIFLFSIFYSIEGLKEWNEEKGGYETLIGISVPFEKYIYFSVITFTTVGYGEIHPYSTWGRRLAMIEAGMGIITMSLFVALYARKFMR